MNTMFLACGGTEHRNNAYQNYYIRVSFGISYLNQMFSETSFLLGVLGLLKEEKNILKWLIFSYIIFLNLTLCNVAIYLQKL